NLINIKKKYDEEFNYLKEETRKTYADNQREFQKLCLSINKNDHNPRIVSKLFEEFKQKFPMRPNMLKSIPEYCFKDIHINDFIIKLNQFEENLTINSISNEHNNSFIPINNTQISSLSTNSSYHKQLASQ